MTAIACDGLSLLKQLVDVMGNPKPYPEPKLSVQDTEELRTHIVLSCASPIKVLEMRHTGLECLEKQGWLKFNLTVPRVISTPQRVVGFMSNKTPDQVYDVSRVSFRESLVKCEPSTEISYKTSNMLEPSFRREFKWLDHY